LPTETVEVPEPSDAHSAGAQAPSRIVFEDVVKKFGNNVVLNDLNFSVDRGERVTLIGPSGSGKTTILRLLMTLEDLTDGYIYVDGDPLTHANRDGRRVKLRPREVSRIRRRIGMVFQQFNLFPNMSVIENVIEAPIHVLGTDKEQARDLAQTLLDQVGLGDKTNAHPTQLSGGQQQRVAIARALAMEPEILLLDEVTSALDPELVKDVLGVLRDVAETTDITMLIVTHEMQFARDVSHRVLMFDQGHIIEDAKPDVMFTEPTQQRTRDFLEAIL